VVTHQLQAERRTGKVRPSETDVLPLCHATNPVSRSVVLIGSSVQMLHAAGAQANKLPDSMDAGALGNRPIKNNYQAVTKIAGLATVRHFYPAMLCIRGTSQGHVSVRLSQVGVLSKRLNESSWFLACELHSTRPTLC